LGVSPSNGM